ncbi:MAG: MBL fold metallo-hydrolase [Propionibacterium sp.]|nr:MBL fold metallo-hydrolase [Propionibacterium sp.]
MLVERIKAPGLAHICYLIGNEGEAVVVDPGRDIDTILTTAQTHGLTIRHILETHRQEDFVIGAAPLAEVTGARIVVGADPHFGHGDIVLADGEELETAGLIFRALATPGHTPESTCYAVFLPEIEDLAWGVFTGDTLFIGDTGRTDLPDPTRTGQAAGELYDAVHSKLAPLGDQTLLFPAHGAGSVCGADIADRDDSTLGLEKVSNPVFLLDRDEFIRRKVDERSPRPPYFVHMEEINAKGGIAPVVTANRLSVLQPQDFRQRAEQGIVIDIRPPEAFAAGHLPGSYSIWAEGLSMFAGWIAEPDTPVYLVTETVAEATLEQAVMALARIGVDGVRGVLAGGFEAWRDAGLPLARIDTTTPGEVGPEPSAPLLDVRDDGEFEGGHVPAAHHLYVGYVEEHVDKLGPEIDRDSEVLVSCGVGHRASVAASMLRRAGFSKVTNLLGGMTAWQECELPLTSGPSDRSVTTPDIEGPRS